MARQRGFAKYAISTLAVLTLGLAACGSGNGDEGGGNGGDATDNSDDGGGNSDSGGGEGAYTIAIVPKDSTNPWFVRMEEGVEQFNEESEHNVFQRGPSDTDATLQAQVIQDLIAQDVDAIAVVPVDPAAIENVLQQALDADIVVVTHEGASQENTMYNIDAFDNNAYGGFIMDNLAAAMGEEGVYTTMVGHVTNASHNEWADGAVERQLEAYPNMQLLEAQPRVESEDNAEVAYQAANQLLTAYPELRGIVGTSSFDAPGAARAIEENGLIGEVFTSGTGMPADNRDILERGIVESLTLWDPAGAGYALASLATKILDGEEITDGLDLGVDGYRNMQFAEGSDKLLEGDGWIEITADNVDDLGF